MRLFDPSSRWTAEEHPRSSSRTPARDTGHRDGSTLHACRRAPLPCVTCQLYMATPRPSVICSRLVETRGP